MPAPLEDQLRDLVDGVLGDHVIPVRQAPLEAVRKALGRTGQRTAARRARGRPRKDTHVIELVSAAQPRKEPKPVLVEQPTQESPARAAPQSRPQAPTEPDADQLGHAIVEQLAGKPVPCDDDVAAALGAEARHAR